MADDEYTAQQITVTIRTKDEWDVLLKRAHRFWRDTPQQQLNAEVEHLLVQYAKLKPAAAGQPRAVRRPRAQAA